MTPRVQNLLDHFLELKKRNQLPHAILIDAYEEGPHFLAAANLVRLLVCQNSSAPCGKCESCKRIATFQSPDLYLIYPLTGETYRKHGEEKGKDLVSLFHQNPFVTLHFWAEHLNAQGKHFLIQAERIRQLRNQLYLAPYHLPVKVVLIWYAELMHPVAANALLKILEEPPPQTFFILTTERKQKVLPTIRSRCQTFRLLPESAEFLNQWLSEHPSPHSTQVRQHFFILADGSPGKLLRLFNQLDGESLFQFLTKWIQALLQDQLVAIYELNQQFSLLSSIEKTEAIRLFAHYLLLSQTNRDDDAPLLVNTLRQQLSLEGALTLIEELDKAIFHIQRNVSPSFWFLHFYLLFRSVVENRLQREMV